MPLAPRVARPLPRPRWSSSVDARPLLAACPSCLEIFDLAPHDRHCVLCGGELIVRGVRAGGDAAPEQTYVVADVMSLRRAS